jgi:WD40 repeat protein
MHISIRASFVALTLGIVATAAEPQPPKVDRHGDILPEGAVARLGKVRFTNYPDYLFPSRDGKSIIAVRYGVHISVFDRATGRLTEMHSLPTEPAWEVAFSQDGRRVLLARNSQGKSIPETWEIWDLDSGKKRATIRPASVTGSYMRSLSPDGRLVVGASEIHLSEDNSMISVRVWDAETGKQLGSQFELPLSGFGRGGWWQSYPRFTADGKSILYERGNGGLGNFYCIDPATMTLRWQRSISAAGGSSGELPDGRLLLSGNSGIDCLNLSDGENCSAALPAKPFDTVGLTRDGTKFLYMVGEGNKRELRSWDWKQGKPAKDIPALLLPPGPSTWATGYASHSGKDVLVWDRAWRLYDLQTAKPLWPDTTVDAGHTAAVTALIFSADGQRLASASADNFVRVWNVAEGCSLGQWPIGSPFMFLEPTTRNSGSFGPFGKPAMDLSLDGQKLAFVEPAKEDELPTLRVVETASGRTLARGQMPKPNSNPGGGHPATFGRIGFSLSEGSLAVVSGEQTSENLGPSSVLSNWDFVCDNWKTLGPVEQSPGARSAMNRTGTHLFTQGKSYNLRTGKQIDELSSAALGPLELSPDGRLVAGLGSTENTFAFNPFFQNIRDIRMWDARTGQVVASIPWELPAKIAAAYDPEQMPSLWPRNLAFDPTGRWLATADIYGVRLWDLLDCTRPIHKFPLQIMPPPTTDFGSPATALAFTPDGTRLATGMPDGTILFWSVPKPKANPVRADELDGLWSELIGHDTAKGWKAAWRLQDDPIAAVELIRKKLKPAEGIADEDLKRWLADVDSPEFRRREAATKKLESAIDRVLPAVTKAAESTMLSPEARERLRKVLNAAPSDDRPLPAWAGGLSRAVAVLEHAGTTEGRNALAELSKGAPAAWLTRESAAAFERIQNRGTLQK